MKARLVRDGSEIKLILCSGTVIRMDNDRIREFFSTYKDSDEYDMSTSIESFVEHMMTTPGETLAYINNDGDFVVRNPKFFTGLFTVSGMEYITAQEFADRHEKSSGIIKRFCREDRIPGAIKIGGRWCVPENSKYPQDPRVSKF